MGTGTGGIDPGIASGVSGAGGGWAGDGGMAGAGGMSAGSTGTGGMSTGTMGTGTGGIDPGIASGVSGAGGGWAGDGGMAGAGRVSMRRDGGGFSATVGGADANMTVSGNVNMGGGFSSGPPDLVGQAPTMGYGTPAQPQPGPPMFDNTVLTTVSGTLTESLSVLKEIRDALLRSEKNAIPPAANDTRSDSAKLKDNYSGKIPQESRNVPQTAVSLKRSIL